MNEVKKIGVAGSASLIKASEQIVKATQNLKNFGVSSSEASQNLSEFKKQANLEAGLSAKGKTRNPNYRGDKSKMRPSTIIGRVLNNKGSVIFSGLNVRGQESKPHKLHGQLNRAIRVNVPLKDGSGFIQKLEKVKIALQKGLIKTA